MLTSLLPNDSDPKMGTGERLPDHLSAPVTLLFHYPGEDPDMLRATLKTIGHNKTAVGHALRAERDLAEVVMGHDRFGIMGRVAVFNRFWRTGDPQEDKDPHYINTFYKYYYAATDNQHTVCGITIDAVPAFNDLLDELYNPSSDTIIKGPATSKALVDLILLKTAVLKTPPQFKK